MSSYKVTKFSAANIAGDCKLVDNKLKSSGGSDIIFPSSGGELALASAISAGAEKTVIENVSFSGGNCRIVYAKINEVELLTFDVSFTKAMNDTSYESGSNSNLAGCGEWWGYVPICTGSDCKGHAECTLRNNGSFKITKTNGTTISSGVGQVTLIHVPTE